MEYNSTIKKNLSGDSSQKTTLPNNEPKEGKQAPPPALSILFPLHMMSGLEQQKPDRHPETR